MKTNIYENGIESSASVSFNNRNNKGDLGNNRDVDDDDDNYGGSDDYQMKRADVRILIPVELRCENIDPSKAEMSDPSRAAMSDPSRAEIFASWPLLSEWYDVHVPCCADKRRRLWIAI